MSRGTLLKALLCLGLVCAAHCEDTTQNGCQSVIASFQAANCDVGNLTQPCAQLGLEIVSLCEVVNGSSCEAQTSYPGPTTEADDCASAPCENGATCVHQVNGFTCQCQAGYTGHTCDTDIDDCASDPCEDVAICVDQVNGFTCQCEAGYTGRMCDTVWDLPATTYPTASTDDDDDDDDEADKGITESENIDDCASAPCENGATCVDQVNGFTCQCQAGYTGQTCDTDIDDCASDPCEDIAICVDQVNGFTCQCEAGYTGRMCDTATCLGGDSRGWFDRSCSSDVDCKPDNSYCRPEGNCRCKIGYFYSRSSQCCLADCPNLSGSAYHFQGVRGVNYTTDEGYLGQQRDDGGCYSACVFARPGCVAFTMDASSRKCRFYNVTALDVHVTQGVANIIYRQRGCL